MNQNEGFFANISVTWKLNIIIGVMTLGLVIISLTGATGLASNQSTVVASYNHILNSSTAISSINNSLSVIQFNIEPLLNPNISLNDIKIYQNVIDDAMEKILTAFEDYESTHLSTNSPELSTLLQEQNFQGLQDQELNAFRSFRNSFTQFEIAETQFKYLRDSDVNEGYFANLTTSRLIQTRLDLQLLVEVNNRYAEIIDETSVSAYQNTIGAMLLALIIAIFFGWLLSNSISRSISSRLGQLERSASSLEEHTYDIRYALSIGGKDEISRLSNAFDRMFKQLQSTLIGLEERVDERTASLATATKESEKRAEQFEAVTLVGGAISSIRSLEDLLPKITELISQQFGYYHAGIFLSDANNEYAVLNAANSEGGQHMLQRGPQTQDWRARNCGLCNQHW